MAFGQVVRESERCVRDFRIFPRAEFVHTALVRDGDNVARCTAHRRPCQDGLGRRGEQTVSLGVEHLAVRRRGQHGLSGRYNAVDVVNVIQHQVGVIGVVRIFRGVETVGRTRASNHRQHERHGGVAVRDVALSQAGQIPFHPTEGVVQGQG